MAIITKTGNNNCWQVNGEKRTPCTVGGWEVCTGAAIIENSMEVPQNTKNRTTIQSSNSTSGYLSKGNEITVLKRYLHAYVHCR